MPQAKADKIFFEFAGGINTEVSPLSFPDGISLDEENFEMQPDGTRRRRKGLRLEEDGVQIDSHLLGLSDDTSAFAYHRWNNVGGDSTLRYLVFQVGHTLLFFTDSDTPSASQLPDTVDLEGYATTDNPANSSRYSVSFADGQGFLFVTGPYIEPLRIEWNEDDSLIEVTPIEMRIRDFQGIDDGIPVTTTPLTLSDDHYYNLRNRGWKDEIIDQYFSDKAVYPAKNMIPWFGYRRKTETGYADEDGEKEWNSTKLELEVFGASSSPQGSLYLDPFDTRNSALDSVIGDLTITTWDKVDAFESWIITITTASAHGLVIGDTIVISGNRFKFGTTSGGVAFNGFNGTFTVDSTPALDQLTITYFNNPNFSAFIDQYDQIGIMATDGLPNSDGIVTNKRPSACAWYASRVFYAGMRMAEYSDTIFFSQIVIKENQAGRCYQENDPTSEHLSELLPTDGGTIQVPGMGGVLKMVPFGSALYVFTKQGIWEIGPGQGGFFSANGFSVRKVTDIECSSQLGIVSGDFGIVFTSPRGIYTLSQDPNSGFVVAQSLSEGRIQTLWNAIPREKQNDVQCVFDSALKRYYVLYATDNLDPFFLDKALVFDARRTAWYKMKFPGTTTDAIMGVFGIEAGDASDSRKKMKFLLYRDGYDGLDIADMDHTDFEDFDGTEQVPYLLTGYDNVGDFQRRRQAPVCHVFMRRTETGYEEVDDELVPINESSIFLEARWDWADRELTGKFSTPQQIYRHVRHFHPETPTSLDGLPVVVTRNKLRGRGRALHLHFYGEEGKDAHLLGWALKYAGAREV